MNWKTDSRIFVQRLRRISIPAADEMVEFVAKKKTLKVTLVENLLWGNEGLLENCSGFIGGRVLVLVVILWLVDSGHFLGLFICPVHSCFVSLMLLPLPSTSFDFSLKAFANSLRLFFGAVKIRHLPASSLYTFVE